MSPDTISAICTAAGEGAVGIVRISGPGSAPIAGKIFKAKSALSLEAADSHKMLYGHVCDQGDIIDEAFCVYMRAPRSYTAEDVVEIHCHGGRAALGKVLALTRAHGARMAEPGEFTQRAFLNGRIDLAQAEAVMSIIRAGSASALRQAVYQQEGMLSAEIKAMRAKLKDLLARARAALDYPEEDLRPPSAAEELALLTELKDQADRLLNTAPAGRIIKDGLRAVIAGRPNVGKSSLLNSLAGYEAAIVTEVAGTTRDSIEQELILGDMPLILVDTAGVRETADKVEKIGIEKSLEKMGRADLILFVLDGSEPLTADDRFLLANFPGKPCLVLINKSDLPARASRAEVKALASCAGDDIINISVKDKSGWPILQERLRQKAGGAGALLTEGACVQEQRHAELLAKAAASLGDAKAAARADLPLDCLLIDCENAFCELGKITGETASDEILREIFSRFCLGK
ncbi:MAG: tRNA uridine-5-carboxymethylaminomethyl(34) synthesis GTPase MnmE [Acidaminococcales bacterium]|jgi:tRNA modification GTPase|nr:tRNA uridine-5-carboxymethylaminomethyl(34) synthesis GTPase MnmE [Acidaminococcales bacterium]